MALPGDPRYFLCPVHTLVPCQPNPTRMQFSETCPSCGHSGNVTGRPAIADLKIPETPFLLGRPAIPMENACGTRWIYLASDVFIEAFKGKS